MRTMRTPAIENKNKPASVPRQCLSEGVGSVQKKNRISHALWEDVIKKQDSDVRFAVCSRFSIDVDVGVGIRTVIVSFKGSFQRSFVQGGSASHLALVTGQRRTLHSTTPQRDGLRARATVPTHNSRGAAIAVSLRRGSGAAHSTSWLRLRWMIMSWTESMVILSRLVSVALVKWP